MSLFECDCVLVPIDFSEASFRVLSEALASFGVEKVQALHVLRPLNPGDPGAMWRTVDANTRKRRVEQVFRDRCGDKEVAFEVLVGDPGAKILEFAKRNGVGLIALPARGQRGLQRFLLGSVSERVIRHAQCPVLVWRG